MSIPARSSRPTRLAAGLAMTALVVLTAGACSSGDAEPAPESATSASSTEISTEATGSETTGTETTATSPATSRTAASPSRGSGSGTGTASTMTCAQFRELDDAERSAVLTDLDVTANAKQVATVAATVCLSRPDDTIAAVVAELVPR
ncbi:hypothetical protein [Gordonia sp. NPDC058843]|uniref:hypothetical protein n=1 Tax=Gordonia sp. NPDC058843 TaxID=3346648 RepID=UPI0036883177